jgi:hypothetical protein
MVHAILMVSSDIPFTLPVSCPFVLCALEARVFKHTSMPF